MNKILTYLFIFFGWVLLCIAAYLLMFELEPSYLFYVNTTALSLVYVLVFTHVFDLRRNFSENEHTPVGLGFSWYGITTYMLLTFVIVPLSYLLNFSLLTALLLHFVAIFILLLFILFSRISVNSVTRSMNKIQRREESKNKILSQIKMLELEVKIKPGLNAFSPQIDTLKNDIHYVTHSDSIDAKNIEEKIANTISEMIILCGDSIADTERWNTLFAKCETLIKLRRQIY